MTCPFCKSSDVEVPEVDIGVGMAQIGPAICHSCGSFQNGLTVDSAVWTKAMPEADPHSTVNILRLAAIHINRYQNRVRMGERGDRNIRLSECRGYLKLWEGIRDKGGDWKALSPAEQQEIREAVESGE